ncbi:hypothetical protein, partial [Zavarzinella formosa]|uniref:hypothetical protein n=1 Tax=Zavarzinella formosa TaxID=360055 RepID=UPI0005933A46
MPASTFELVFHPNNTASWLHDGRPVGSEISVSGVTAKSLGEIRLAFQAIFDRPGRPVVDPEMLRSLGRILYDTFFKSVESDLPSPSAGGSRTLFIRSADPAMFNLPWELVWLPGKDLPIGCDPTWAVLRVPGAPCPAAAPDPGPVRLLFLAAAPSGGVPLDFEKEEDAMLRATQRLKENIIVLPFAETGGLDELAKLVAEHRPHVV